jgi:hypothetical protein
MPYLNIYIYSSSDLQYLKFVMTVLLVLLHPQNVYMECVSVAIYFGILFVLSNNSTFPRCLLFLDK